MNKQCLIKSNAAFAQIGIEATFLLAIELDITKLETDLVYHTPRDTTDTIEPALVEQALNIIAAYILKGYRIFCLNYSIYANK